MRKKTDTTAPQVETDDEGTVVAVPISGNVMDAVRRLYASGPAPTATLTPDGFYIVQGERSPADEPELGISDPLPGMRVSRDERGASITIPPPPAAEVHRDEDLFSIGDSLLIELIGLRAALAQPDSGGRYERAMLLARHGRLSPREVGHLQWLATAERPQEDVVEGTVQLTQEQAATLVAVLDERAQLGRHPRRVGMLGD